MTKTAQKSKMQLSSNQQTPNKIHFNAPQIEYAAIMPQIGLNIMGRGTGKTEGNGAYYSSRCVFEMPGSLGGILCVTYDKILNMIIPALKIGWERLGFKENVHYWIRKAPPGNLKIPDCYRQPSVNSHLIKWFNGSGILLISLDRLHISNGSSLAWLLADEVKFFGREKFKEVMLTLRGQASLYGDSSLCESILLTTDQPRPDMPGEWVYELEEKSDPHRAMAVMAAQFKIYELEDDILKSNNKRTIIKKNNEIKRLSELVNTARKGLIYCSRASTLENVHALGLQAILNMHAQLSPYEFALSVLNRRMRKNQNAFYYLLSDEKHGYYAPNINYIDTLPNEPGPKDCLWDADIDFSLPLEISCDYNSAINWVVIGQDNDREVKILNSLFVLNPGKIKDLVEQLDKYYAHKKTVNNTIVYHYDHTAIGTSAKDDISFADEWISHLQSAGWYVMPNYIGQSPTHKSRFYLYEAILGGNPEMPPLRFNMSNNIELMISLYSTKTGTDRNGDYSKDKSSERKNKIPAEQATHGGEALDGLVWPKYRSRIKGEQSFLMVHGE